MCNHGDAQSFEKGLLQYAKAMMEIDVRFLEQVRDEICCGVDAFDSIAQMKMTARMEKQVPSLIHTDNASWERVFTVVIVSDRIVVGPDSQPDCGEVTYILC